LKAPDAREKLFVPCVVCFMGFGFEGKPYPLEPITFSEKAFLRKFRLTLLRAGPEGGWSITVFFRGAT